MCADRYLLATATGAARAQAYPSKPIRMIVPFTPGSATDIITRTKVWKAAGVKVD